MVMNMNKVLAKSYWVWTQKAESADPKRHRAGEMVWPHYAKEAPQKWVDEGLIVDRAEYAEEGQLDLIDLLDM